MNDAIDVIEGDVEAAFDGVSNAGDRVVHSVDKREGVFYIVKVDVKRIEDIVVERLEDGGYRHVEVWSEGEPWSKLAVTPGTHKQLNMA